ncbi:hypothetical protein Q7P37_004261 [Cladosporium fusiforme]
MATTQTPKVPKMGTETITVLVGPEGGAKKVILHADLVKLHSTYIDNAADQLKALANTEGVESRPVRLSSLPIDDFEVFCAFMYTGHIYTIHDDEQNVKEWELLAKLWVLGKSIQSTSFQDAVVDALMHRGLLSGKYQSKLQLFLAEHLHEPNGMRNFLVDVAASHWNEQKFEDLPASAECVHFYKQLIVTLSAIANGKKVIITTIMIEVHVGASDHIEKFLVHEALAKRRSKFITAALKKCWDEGKQRIVTLPEVSPETFQLFCDFVNTGFCQIPVKKDQEDAAWVQVTDAWLLGDYLDSTSFKDAILDTMLAAIRQTSNRPISMFQEIFGCTRSPSGMRRLLVDLVVYSWPLGTLAKQPVEERCLDFFRDVSVAIELKDKKGLISWDAPYMKDDIKCHYHDHGSEEGCYRKG